ncbi:ABC transporter ATP-binding protein [Agrobacterium rhizogenes]|uniref:ABC transporter ATP-binding protein n=1 Tax=Rhizobium rhizogenes TaxID=359 RepID=UPI0015731F72|nr:ABC transporter ATP-binding protein [Rhizobium rhizogenes]NTG51704.1 ABC transporter ATP-binding protein [Rhizobium rhizogenes]
MSGTGSRVGEAASFQGVGKVFNGGKANEYIALRSIDFSVGENEFFTLLGPSGCGKTTLLRILAGFEQPSEGRIEIFGRDVVGLPANRRPVNTVFQHYALFPHLTVRENVGFALRMKGVPKADLTARVERILDLVHMQSFGDRKPDQLSGGQKQRVALARALAPNPQILLLDEPLSALDLKLRQAMRWELKNLQRETGITFVFVTHDQEEALAMSDRIAVLSQGSVQQIGRPAEIYEHPANRFVADFIGESNLLSAEVVDTGPGSARVRLGGNLILSGPAMRTFVPGEKVTLSIRPERIILDAEGKVAEEQLLRMKVVGQIYLGNAIEFRLKAGDVELVARAPKGGVRGRMAFDVGQDIAIGFEPDAIRVLGG